MKIIIIAGNAESLINFRYQLIQEMQKLKHEVIALAPFEDDQTVRKLANIGVKCVKLPVDATGMNPLADFRFYKLLRSTFREIKPDLVLSYTIKPVIYGSIAASKEAVPKMFSMITGVGSVFIGSGFTVKCLRFFVKWLYTIALKKNTKVFFQNPDDSALFLQNGLVSRAQVLHVNGSGVDCKYFSPRPNENKRFCFTLIARIIADKGIYEYIEAAKLVKEKKSNIDFKLIGPASTNPSAIKLKTIQKFHEEGIIDYLGNLCDVRNELVKTDVFVLPSYGEGTPRSILEAMAMAKPILTTDVPGCRETVIDGENGFLVPAKKIQPLVNKMLFFIENDDFLIRMGEKSRQLAEDKFDVHKVNNAMLAGLFCK